MKPRSVLAFLVLMAFGCKKDYGPAPGAITFGPGEGGYHNLVTIHGSHFGNSKDNIGVYFNGVRAESILDVTDSFMLVTVPMAATTGKIAVSKAGKTSVSEADYIILPGQWRKKGEHPGTFTPRSGAASFVIDTIAYYGMGRDGDMNYLNSMMAFNPFSNTWVARAASPATPMQTPVSIVIGSKAYMGVGLTTAGTSPEFWQYDPVADNWTRKADFPDSVAQKAIGASFGDRGYVGVGRSKNGKKSWYEYDPANNSWIAKADFPGSLMDYPVGFALHGKVFAGLDPLNAPHEWWQYDTASNQWSRMKDFPVIFDSAPTSFVAAEKGYVVAGSECWQYNDQTDSWLRVAYLDANGCATFSIHNKGYCVGGTSYFFPKGSPEIWEFTPPN